MAEGLGEAILGLHFVIIGFNVLGLIVIPLGAWAGWGIVRVAWLRLLHLGVLAVVAGQAVLGRACFLTDWQVRLTGGVEVPQPMIMQWVNSVIYWKIPIWGFAIIYCAVFAYVLALTWLVPFGRRVGV